MTAELSDSARPDVNESAVASAEVDRVIQVLEQGGDLNSELDAPAAGLAGWTGGDSNSFVRLLRIVESVDPLGFDFRTQSNVEFPSMVFGMMAWSHNSSRDSAETQRISRSRSMCWQRSFICRGCNVSATATNGR